MGIFFIFIIIVLRLLLSRSVVTRGGVEMSHVGFKVIVTGLVQGVCFRYSTAQQAHKLNIVGHAKNLQDGSVEVIMFGEQATCQRLLGWLKEGPKQAQVEKVSIIEIAHEHRGSFLSY